MEHHKIIINAVRFGSPILLMVFAGAMQWKKKHNRPLPTFVIVLSFLAVIAVAISCGYLLAFYGQA